MTKQKSKRDYNKGDKCWNCGKKIVNPKNHYPINATMFCKPEHKRVKKK